MRALVARARHASVGTSSQCAGRYTAMRVLAYFSHDRRRRCSV